MGIGSPWYPDADPADLRRAAQAYSALADAIDRAGSAGNGAMRRFFASNRSATIEPYREAWEALYGSGACGAGYMGQLSSGCRHMAGGLEEAAQGIEELRNKIDTMVGAGAVVTIGVGLITFGLGSAAAGAATAGTVATTVTIAISQFLTRVAIVAAFEFVGGYITSLSLQAIRQVVFEPGRPIEFDHGEALTVGGISALAGGALYAVPGIYSIRRNINLIRVPGTTGLLSPARTRGALGELATTQRLIALGETPITQKQISAVGATGRGSTATADVVLSQPGPAARSLFPNPGGGWQVGVLEVKAGYAGKTAAEILSPGQTGVLVPLATNGGRLSAPLARELGIPSRLLQPGQASKLVVVRIPNEEFARIPLTLRVALERHGMQGVLAGEAGARNAVRLRQWMDSIRFVTEVP